MSRFLTAIVFLSVIWVGIFTTAARANCVHSGWCYCQWTRSYAHPSDCKRPTQNLPKQPTSQNTFVAISETSDGNDIFAMWGRYNSGDAAVNGSQRYCREETSASCTSLGWARNACLAITRTSDYRSHRQSRQSSGWGYDTNDAIDNALSNCSTDYPFSDCEHRVTYCSNGLESTRKATLAALESPRKQGFSQTANVSSPDGELNFRTRPNLTNSKISQVLRNGDEVSIKNCDFNDGKRQWCYVFAKGQEGFVAMKYLTMR